MSVPKTAPVTVPNGPGAAAVLAAGIGAFLLAVFAAAADHIAQLRSYMTFYRPTGPLSGVTTSAIVAWLLVWLILHWRWRRRNLPLGRIQATALVLLTLSLLVTFPPISDLF